MLIHCECVELLDVETDIALGRGVVDEFDGITCKSPPPGVLPCEGAGGSQEGEDGEGSEQQL
ncbi:unannotated protein [freshwater metagenome]|uniref:Unannotated protein n=1 Tax=freshwater metagenome TaxID=449393 RepID=A0A6J7J3Z2_9ZZZZ